MCVFAVIREAGPNWNNGGIAAQPDLSDHAAYMNALGDEGFVLFAGPLAGTERHRLRVLLIVNAETADEVAGRLAADPWTRARRLEVVSVEPWNILVGGQRLADVVEA
jgi:uncharacterized protein YciI